MLRLGKGEVKVEETLKERLETILQRHIYLEKMMQLPQIAADFSTL